MYIYYCNITNKFICRIIERCLSLRINVPIFNIIQNLKLKHINNLMQISIYLSVIVF